MAIGRISGPLLKANLLRDGVDLAFESDLLYLDVINRRIGVKTKTPSHDLTIDGTTRTTNLLVDTAATIASKLAQAVNSTEQSVTLDPIVVDKISQANADAPMVSEQQNTETNQPSKLSQFASGSRNQLSGLGTAIFSGAVDAPVDMEGKNSLLKYAGAKLGAYGMSRLLHVSLYRD